MLTFLTSEEMRFLRRHFSPRIIDLSRNEILYPQNLEDGSALLLLDGLVYLCAETEQFSRSVLRFYRPGELFAGNALLPAEHSVSYFLAKSNCRLAVFGRNHLIRFFLSSPQWQNKLEMLLGSSDLSHVFLLHQRTIRAKLLRFFHEETAIQHGSVIRLPIPFTDLADYLAVERTAMMKELKKMKDEGIISGKQRILTIR